jgi:hypothetical protein
MGRTPIDVHALQGVLNTMASLGQDGQDGPVLNIFLLKQVINGKDSIRTLH